MPEEACGTCKHYQPSPDVEGCGMCTSDELWSARPQEVPADMHACAGIGSEWTPVAVSTSSPVADRRLSKGVVWLRWIGIIGLFASPLVLGVDLFVGIPGIPEIAILWFLLSVGALLIGLVWGKV